uniref:Uncharacterized protein n=1 Tax=Syphacia muris TaxID=451379 RepID=A0A0N5AY57_9BILA
MVQGELVPAESFVEHFKLRSNLGIMFGKLKSTALEAKSSFRRNWNYGKAASSNNSGDQSPDKHIPITMLRRKHFRDTEEWKKKKCRLLLKMRALGKINLALLLARMPSTVEAL